MISSAGLRVAVVLTFLFTTVATGFAQTPMPAQKFTETPTPLPPPPASEPLGVPSPVAPPIAEMPLAPPMSGEMMPYPFAPPEPSGSATVTEDHRRHIHFKQPLPGSIDDAVTRDYVGRQGFRFNYYDCPVTLFPTTLLWEPPLAIFREPRFALYAASDNGLQNFGISTVDTSIGVNPALVRFEPAGSDLAIQVDLFGVVHTRWDGDDQLASSYRFGVPVTFRRGPWNAKISYEHTIDTLSRGYTVGSPTPLPLATTPTLIGATPQPRWEREEVVFGLGRIFSDQLRLYGQVAYATKLTWPTTDVNRTRYDIGFEWYNRCPTGWPGTPFVAGNINYDGVTNYEAGYTIQAGWLWRNPELRLNQGRIFLQYANGRSQFAPFSAKREDTIAFGIAADY